MRLDLNSLFPPTPAYTPHRIQNGGGRATIVRASEAPNAQEGKQLPPVVPTRWTAIYALELRGLSKKEIAEQLHLSYATVLNITTDERYADYRDERLAVLDREFVSMKPLAMDALRKGLVSGDENTALRASEQWFKGASFGGYSKQEPVQQGLTAEDVASALMQAVQVNVNVNVAADARSQNANAHPPHTPPVDAINTEV